MSVSLPFLRGGAAKPGIVEAVTEILSKTAPRIALKPLCVRSELKATRDITNALSKGSAVLGAGLKSEDIAMLGTFFATHTHTSAAAIKNLSPEYSAVDLCVVRTIISDPELCALRYRDRLDSLQGFNLSKEMEHAKHCIERAVHAAILEAKLHKCDTISAVLKSVSRHEKINGLFTEIAQEACKEAGVNFTSSYTAQFHNRMLLFPEQFRVILANDVPASDHLEGIVLGMSGGAGITYQTLLGTEVKGFVGAASESPVATLMAACEAMKHLGLKEESDATQQVLTKALAKAANRTKDIGGTLTALDFAKACFA